jgi:phage shock protein A
MVTRYKSIRDMVEAQHEYDISHMGSDSPYKHIETVSEAMDRIRQKIADREEERDLNAEAGVRCGAVVRDGSVIEFPERRKKICFQIG